MTNTTSSTSGSRFTSNASEGIASEVSLNDTFKESLTGEVTLPEYSGINPSSKVITVLGGIYSCLGLCMLFAPNAIFNNIVFMSEPFSAEMTVYVRTAGFPIFAGGTINMFVSQAGHPYQCVALIFEKLCITTPAMIILTTYGVPTNAATLFILLDVVGAIVAYIVFKQDVVNGKIDGMDDVSLLGVFKECFVGEHLIPPFSSLGHGPKTLVNQGIVYSVLGFLAFFTPNSIFAKLLLLPAGFNEEEKPFMRVVGFFLFLLGTYYSLLSRTNKTFVLMVSIFARIVIVEPFMILLVLYGTPIQLAGAFFIADPILSYRLHLAMKKDFKEGNYDQLP